MNVQSKYYQPVNQSSAIEQRQMGQKDSLNKRIGLNSLQQIISDKYIEEILQGQVQELYQIEVYKKQIDLKQMGQLSFIMKCLLRKFGFDLKLIQIFSILVDKQKQTIVQLFLKEASVQLLRNIQQMKVAGPKKIYMYKYQRHFCNICQIYGSCPHFSEETRFFYLSKKQKQQIYNDEVKNDCFELDSAKSNYFSKYQLYYPIRTQRIEFYKFCRCSKSQENITRCFYRANDIKKIKKIIDLGLKEEAYEQEQLQNENQRSFYSTSTQTNTLNSLLPASINGSDIFQEYSVLEESIRQSGGLQFKKFEKQLIQYCKTQLSTSNPCFIALLLKQCQQGYQSKSCLQIAEHLEGEFQLSKNMSKASSNYNKVEQGEPNEKQKNTLQRYNQKFKQQMSFQYNPYNPCFHEGPCTTQNCLCIKERGICEKFCCCFHLTQHIYTPHPIYKQTCQYQWQGCTCSVGQCHQKSQQCQCIKYDRECDPQLCKCCANIDPKYAQNIQLINEIQFQYPNCCQNTALQYNVKKRILIGKSDICMGSGLFCGQKLHEGDFIGEYKGELLTFDEMEKREILYNNLDKFYTFTLSQEKILDAYAYGNKLRFVNHAKHGLENAQVILKFVNGNHKIGFYAKRDIEVGEEIYFDYGSNFKTDWIIKFNQLCLNAQNQQKQKERHQLVKQRFQKKINKFKMEEDESNIIDEAHL